MSSPGDPELLAHQSAQELTTVDIIRSVNARSSACCRSASHYITCPTEGDWGKWISEDLLEGIETLPLADQDELVGDIPGVEHPTP